jgi:hypothetical protein
LYLATKLQGMQHRIAWTATALGILVLCSAIVGLGWTPRNKRVSLPGGESLEIWGLSRDATAPEQGPMYRRLVAPRLPDGLRTLLKWPLLQLFAAPGSETLICWQHNESSMPPGGWPTISGQWIEDRHGCRVPGELQFASSRLQTVTAILFKSYPRREEEFTLIIPREGQEAATVRLASAPRRTYPHWTSPPLPARQADGKVEVELLAVGAGGEGRAPSWAGEGQFVQFHFRITKDGNPTRQWRPAGIALSDATGNIVQRHDMWGLQFEETAPGEFRATAMNRLCLQETWEVLITLEQVSGFPPDDLWTFRNVRVPDLHQSADVNQVAYSRGVPLRLDFVVKQQEESLTVPLKASSKVPELILTDLTDARGVSVLEPSLYGVYSSRPDNTHVPIPEGATRLNLAFARSRKAEARFRALPKGPGE